MTISRKRRQEAMLEQGMHAGNTDAKFDPPREPGDIGERERIARLDDIAQMKAGRLTLEMVKERTTERQRQSGLSKARFQLSVSLACGRSRANVGTPSAVDK